MFAEDPRGAPPVLLTLINIASVAHEEFNPIIHLFPAPFLCNESKDRKVHGPVLLHLQASKDTHHKGGTKRMI